MFINFLENFIVRFSYSVVYTIAICCKVVNCHKIVLNSIDNYRFWFYISHKFKLSEEFIEQFQDKVDWDYISQCQNLSEEFIEKFKDKVYWMNISGYQKLSESFIEKFQDKVNWHDISYCQKLSEAFIGKFQNKVCWNCISKFQKLDENSIENFQNRVDWHDISRYQKLSEAFIEKFKDKVDWNCIIKYQKISPGFAIKNNIEDSLSIETFSCNNWLYKDDNFKLEYIKRHTNYKVIDNKYIIAYKGIRSNSYSKFNFQYKYEVGNTYEAHCDCNADNCNSFGLSVWDIGNAKKYCNEKIIKVKVAISDIGCIVLSENKIRCFRFEVLKEVK